MQGEKPVPLVTSIVPVRNLAFRYLSAKLWNVQNSYLRDIDKRKFSNLM